MLKPTFQIVVGSYKPQIIIIYFFMTSSWGNAKSWHNKADRDDQGQPASKYLPTWPVKRAVCKNK